jgi:hypothetical protein
MPVEADDRQVRPCRLLSFRACGGAVEQLEVLSGATLIPSPLPPAGEGITMDEVRVYFR